MNPHDNKTQPTSYPHIVKVEGVCGGEAIIEGTRIAVWHIVGYYYRAGMSVEEILAEWDYVTPVGHDFPRVLAAQMPDPKITRRPESAGFPVAVVGVGPSGNRRYPFRDCDR